jgi:hypothetical protein
MRTDSHRFRLIAATAAAGLALGPLPAGPARAQPAQIDQPAADQPPADQQTADPPARVGRLARSSGTVSFHGPQDTQWSPAARNYPVAPGDAYWTEPRAEAEIELGGGRIAMAGSSELDIGVLDAATVQASEPQGELYLHLRSLAPGESYVLQTPRAAVTITTPGRYAIAVGDTERPTLITVLDGAAQVAGQRLALEVVANQTATVTGTDTMQAEIGPARHDAFIGAMLARERLPPHPPVALPPVVARMPGAEDLASYGAWNTAPDYGAVWYPQVAAGWTPYREGHWAYVAPWGWTWIDDAAWGYAPFHYGRWVDIDGRWAWAPEPEAEPGPLAYPVYAPALVTFFGIGAGVALGAALTAGSIGWYPLGPREPYHPWYHASPGYLRQVNVNSVGNAPINGPVSIGNAVNRGAATVVPASAVVGSQPIGRFGRPVDPTILAAAHPVVGTDPVRPTAATSGVTQAVARQLNLAPGTAPIRPGAPGPTIAAQATGAFAAPHRPPLAGPGQASPGAVAAAPVVPHAGLPALRRPGEIQAGPPPIVHAPGLPAAEPGRETARPGLVPAGSRPAGSTEPSVLARPATVPPLEGTATEPHAGAAGQPHAGASLPAEPQRPVVHAPVAPAVPHQPITAAQHPAPTRITPVAPPVHVAAPVRPELPAARPAFQPRSAPTPQAHFAPPPQVHVAAPAARAFAPPPQGHVALPPPVHVAAPAPQPQHSAPAPAAKPEKRPGER